MPNARTLRQSFSRKRGRKSRIYNAAPGNSNRVSITLLRASRCKASRGHIETPKIHNNENKLRSERFAHVRGCISTLKSTSVEKKRGSSACSMLRWREATRLLLRRSGVSSKSFSAPGDLVGRNGTASARRRGRHVFGRPRREIAFCCSELLPGAQKIM